MKQPEFGRLITSLRKKRRLTQEELAAQCNISIRTLQRIEAGKVTPRNYTLDAILSSLKIDPSDFFENDSKSAMEPLRQILKKGLYFKTHRTRKFVILPVLIFMIAGAFFLFEKEMTFDKDRYIRTDSRGIIYLFSKELHPMSISNTKDTADHQFGNYLVQEYKGKLFLNGEYVGCAYEGDTIILQEKTFFRKSGLIIRHYSPIIFESFNGKNIIYMVPPLPMDLVSCSDESEIYLLGEDQKLEIRESDNQLFLNGEYIGNAYKNDTVILTANGLLTIKKELKKL